MDSGHGGKRSNLGRKRKYDHDGRGKYKKAWSKSHQRIYPKERIFFKSARVIASAHANP